jgi:DNA-binding IclR family transcriptional regulator
VRLSYARFRRGPLHRGASAKILAAYLEPGERGRLLAVIGAGSGDGSGSGDGAGSTDGDGTLAAALDRIRADGFAFTVGELDVGGAAVAAPILDRRSRLVAGLSIAGPAERIQANLPAMTAAVIDAARAIERAQST